ncbi:uncharacterized protein V1516DRAFT_678419 [Lipomyces oligophaga]|uniref:uncharacterized protein n=1 Tax=Lipomyces oligophaga TaxID=45792 RepID=UPI0034CEA4F5
MSTLASVRQPSPPGSPGKRKRVGESDPQDVVKRVNTSGSSNATNDLPIDHSLIHASPISMPSGDGVTSTSTSTVEAKPLSRPGAHALEHLKSDGSSEWANVNLAHAHEHLESLAAAQKPQVGSDEWHRLRRDNHKEVERRRRETINEGISELAKIVPNCEKNKGSILQRAVQYIQQLKENEAANIEKWTLEKLLTDQAISELSTSNDKLKAEAERAWREADAWKKTCASAGIKKKVDE